MSSDDPATALDTSVLVATVVSWHEFHDNTVQAVEELLASLRRIVLPLQALLEAYAVLTRLPPPHRLSSEAAVTVLEGSFADRAELAGLDATAGWSILEELSGRGVYGGSTYDAIIAATARGAGANKILTLNPRDFLRLDDEGLEVVSLLPNE